MKRKGTTYLCMRLLGILSLSLLLVGGALAQKIGVNINGQAVRFAGTGPQKVEGRVLVPVRGIFEALGAYVEYDSVKRVVTANKGDVDISLGLGQRIAVLNGREVLLDVPAQVVGGSTMVPLRFIGEALGAEVTWDNATQVVNISTTQQGDTTDPQDPNTGPDVEVMIRSFGSNATGPLRVGSSVQLVLVGTPGGKASFQIPGVTGEVPMREASSGRYVADLKVEGTADKPVHVVDAYPIAKLKVGRNEKLIQAGDPITIDTGAPQVKDLTPVPDSRSGSARPNITATFDEVGTGIDTDTVRVFLDNKDVTADSTISKSFMAYKPGSALKAGKHTIRIDMADKAGNETSKSWSFEVVGTAEVIKKVAVDAPADPQPGDVVKVTLTGESGGTATFDLGPERTNIRMTETEKGVYVGEYTLRRGEVFRNLKVVARLKTKGGQVFTADSEETIGVRSGPPDAPRITTTEENAVVDGLIVIRGKAEPKTRIKVRVDYRSALLGLLAYNGTLGEQTVETDASGNFVTSGFKMDTLLGSKDVTYTVTAVAIGENDEESEEATLKFSRK